MKEPITHFGIRNTPALMEAFHNLGNDLLTQLMEFYASPNEKKSLRTWKMKDIVKMTGRSEAFIRTLEKSDKIYEPIKINGIRHYTLELINKIRDKTGTRFKRPIGSEPIILAISNFKGGVAKSTTSMHLTHKGALEGKRMLAIDLDPQGTFTLGFGYIPDIDIKEEQTIKDAMIISPDLVHKAIRKTYFTGIDLIPGNLVLSELEILLTDVSEQKNKIKTIGYPNERLKNILDIVKDNYDIIVLDCGPNLGMLTINALTAANALLVPIPPMMSDLGSFVTCTGTLSELLKHINKDFDFFRILISKHPESKESKQLEILMREKFGTYILQKCLVNSVEVEKAASIFSSVYELPNKSTKSYKRAIESLDNVYLEIFDAFKQIWSAQHEE
tara:strand:- start:822 stop:1985 length:1164 start_codon:yes stop_codon:yes gene_type:complete